MSKTQLILLFSFLVLIRTRTNSAYYNSDQDVYKGRAMGEGESCNSENCPSPNSCGTDGDITACICDKKLANYPFTGYEGRYCSYKRKRQLVGFLWELCTNLGIGHYYIRQILRGVFKTIVMLTPIIIFILGKTKLLQVGFDLGITGKSMAAIMYLFFIAAFIWWLVDAIMFGLNKYRDNNDVPLQHW